MASKQPTKQSTNVFSDEERAAMQDSIRERKAAARRSPEEERTAGLQDLLGSIEKMAVEDRAMAQRIHDIVTSAAPSLVPRTFYGMPAYATEGKNGKTICFFQAKSKFKVRYSTFGFQPDARLDDGEMWSTSFAIVELTPEVERRLAELVKRAAG